jgi:hypothetical protein
MHTHPHKNIPQVEIRPAAYRAMQLTRLCSAPLHCLLLKDGADDPSTCISNTPTRVHTPAQVRPAEHGRCNSRTAVVQTERETPTPGRHNFHDGAISSTAESETKNVSNQQHAPATCISDGDNRNMCKNIMPIITKVTVKLAHNQGASHNTKLQAKKAMYIRNRSYNKIKI